MAFNEPGRERTPQESRNKLTSEIADISTRDWARNNPNVAVLLDKLLAEHDKYYAGGETVSSKNERTPAQAETERTISGFVRELRDKTKGEIQRMPFMNSYEIKSGPDSTDYYIAGPSEGEILTIPKVETFASAQDYDHFRHLYDCDNPGYGAVYVVRPAVLKKNKEGDYEIASKGGLEIKKRS